MSILNINRAQAESIARRAYSDGFRYEVEDADLRDYIDLATGGDLDCVEMDIAVDLVRGALLRCGIAAARSTVIDPETPDTLDPYGDDGLSDPFFSGRV